VRWSRARGTVGRAVTAALRERGAQVIEWDRQQISPFDLPAVRAHVASVRPDVLFHLAVASHPTGADNEGWRINVEWTDAPTGACRDHAVRFVFTSTAMVFSNDACGPFNIDSPPDARDGYGFEKRVCEERIATIDPEAIIARIAWQIGDAPGSNNMVDHCVTRMRDEGRVMASTRWLPACAFLPDTAAALVDLADRPGGLYQVDVNDRWTFFDIARALAALTQEPGRSWPPTSSSTTSA
jgi:dTDP-4-dehydrorhamnose reductase